MSDMPERIWAKIGNDRDPEYFWRVPVSRSMQYLRADLAAERERKLMRYVSHDSFCTPALGRDECSCGLCAVRKELGYE